MRLALTLLGLVIVCGCLFGGQDKNVEVVDVGRATSTTVLGANEQPSTTVLRVTSTTIPTTSTTSTVTTSSTTTTILVYVTPERTTTTTAPPITIPAAALKPTTTTTSSTTTTIACSADCYDIKYPSPKNCAKGCCISSDTRCVYMSSVRDGMGCRCR